KASPAPAAKKDTAVASLGTAPVPSQAPSAIVDSGDFEGTVRGNWGLVEAALKEHVKKEYNTYRMLLPSFTGGLDVRLHRATFVELVDAEQGQIKAYLEGEMQVSSWSGGNMLNWRPVRSHFLYKLKFVDGKPVIGEYQYLHPVQN